MMHVVNAKCTSTTEEIWYLKSTLQDFSYDVNECMSEKVMQNKDA